jgi:hypothetical protein
VGPNRTAPRDTDGDGVIDALDDDDDDTLPTIDERAGATAAGSADPDGDGLPAWRDLDSDDDGFADGPDDGLGDVDGDGRPDFLDRDSHSLVDAPPPPDEEEPAGCFGSATSARAQAPLLAFAGLLALLTRRRRLAA